jgi:hypothetical protein
MAIRVVTVPPIGHIKHERMKIILEGNHSAEEKVYMIMKAISMIEHDFGIYRAGMCDFWFAPLDENNCPLTYFADGQPIAHRRLIVDSPYQSAADHYRAG